MIRSLRLAGVSSELTLKVFQSSSTDYVRRVKEYEKLKGNDQAVTDVFQRSSQFVLFLNHQPLLSVTPTDQPNQSGMEYNLRRLSYNGNKHTYFLFCRLQLIYILLRIG